MARDRLIAFRLSEEELGLIQQAAEEDERVLSDFIRLTLLRAIRGKGKTQTRRGKGNESRTKERG